MRTIKFCRRESRSGFTLVELLVAISIIGVLAGMFTVAYRGAQQESYNQKTFTTITKISEVLNSRMEEYANYPLVLRRWTGSGYGPIPSSAIAVNTPGDTRTILLERARLLCLREIIAMEMPDHPDDIKWTDATANNLAALDSITKVIPTGLYLNGNPNSPVLVRNKTTSRVIDLAKRLSVRSGGGFQPVPGWQNQNANAELLYLIVEDSQLNGSSAIELFGASEVRDTDNDGLKEFVDAYGNPIGWVRWPTGFEGVARYHPDMLDPSIITTAGVSIESDPLDRMAADPGYRTAAQKPGPGTFPLVVSAGLDGKFGIRFQLDTPNGNSYSVVDAVWSGGQPAYLSGRAFTDPWFPRDSNAKLGAIISADARDNITNYDGNGASAL
jgi:prepilin-type N-terminal cleavage/methylation domain-containing protein